MGFAQEMRDFLSAAQAGTKILGSVTDREYKELQKDALQKKTDRENDPETLALADKTARANLERTRASIGQIGAYTSLTNERTKNARFARDNAGIGAPAGGSGLLPQGGLAPTMNTGAPASPEDPNFDPGAGLGFADGGLVPFGYTPKGALQSQKLKAAGKWQAPISYGGDTGAPPQAYTGNSVSPGPDPLPPGMANLPAIGGTSAMVPGNINPILVTSTPDPGLAPDPNPGTNSGVMATPPPQISTTVSTNPSQSGGAIGFGGRHVNLGSDSEGGPSMGPAIGSDKTAMRTNAVQTVQGFAEGGLVGEDENNNEDSLAPDTDGNNDTAVTAPTTGPLPTSQATEFSSSDRPMTERRAQGMGISPALVRDAAKSGMQFGLNAFGLTNSGGVRTAQQRAMAQRYLRGEGGLTSEEMEAAGKAIDPDGKKFSPAQRNMAVLGSVYQYQLNKGNPENAQRIAFQMLQHYRAASQRYAAIAAHAAETGNLDLATKAAVQAYANVPDGRDFQVQKTADGRLQYSYTDEVTGKTIAKGIATPQELASSAMGLAAGGFDKAIMAAAGAAEAPAKGGKGTGPKAPTTGDRKTLGGMAAAAVDEAKAAWLKGKEKELGKKEGESGIVPDEGHWGDIRDATQTLLTSNPKLTPRRAAQAVVSMYTVDKDPKKSAGFKIKPGENGTNTVTFDNGMTVELSDEERDIMLSKRVAAMKARDDAAKAAEEEGKKPTFGTRVKALGDALKKTNDEALAREPEIDAQEADATAKRRDAIGGAVKAIGEAWGGGAKRAGEAITSGVKDRKLDNRARGAVRELDRLSRWELDVPEPLPPSEDEEVPAIGAPL